MSFNNLPLIDPILAALRKEGYTTPTPIQQQAIPPILEGRDLLGSAQTGTGKTAAFTIPILQLMFEHLQQNRHTPRPGIQVLILTPTRELATQIGESIRAYGRYLPFKHQVIFGGVSQFHQVKRIREGVDILVATPGRLLDLMGQNIVHLNNIKYFVLDEADRMLDMGFVHDVKRIIAKLPNKKQTLFFSATMPGEIKQLAGILLHNPVKVEVNPVSSTVDIIQQQVYYVSKMDKLSLLLYLLKDQRIKNMLVFIQMKHHADKLARQLSNAGVHCEAIHGNKMQKARENALANFKAGKTRVLVATDIAARGIDIDELTHVLNYDLPNVPEIYVHRIGRTGRAGADGTAISFCDWSEKSFLSEIQKLIKKMVTVVKDHPFDIKLMHAEAVNTNQLPSFGNSRRSSRRRFMRV
ncbi:MAG TPA: DEAD/DEAH box helicase [Puia sp.]|nr:DEAD/DEAH box helicase [Puia sp.]